MALGWQWLPSARARPADTNGSGGKLVSTCWLSQRLASSELRVATRNESHPKGDNPKRRHTMGKLEGENKKAAALELKLKLKCRPGPARRA